MHIEQGPVLLEEGLPLGIVSAIAGTVRCMVTISGTAGHAGTVPMARRHDAAAAAAELVLYVEQRCAQAPTLVGTVGQLAVPNGAINIIPGRCELTLDIRAADDATRDAACSTSCGDRADRAETRRHHREQGSAAHGRSELFAAVAIAPVRGGDAGRRHSRAISRAERATTP